ncbi:hypothetical protein HA402_005814 [Bradysia odoriphaga]|nr:hypothetical protein HA402_005814 [Bradysia odoriphaga]
MFLYFGWIYLGYDRIPNLVSITDVDRKEFDYIIVGAGTVGSVIANKLSSMDNVTVLLIEAGTTFGPLSIIPLLTTFQQNTTVDWAFRTVPQRYSSTGFDNRQQLLPRGKGLGGSSQLNYMLQYNDDIEMEFDKWETYSGSTWKRTNMMKYLLSESNSEDGWIDSDLTSVTDCHIELSHEFRKMSEEFEDLNEDVDFHLAKYHTKKGIRWNVYHKYLRPVFRNENLKILYNTRARKIHFTGNRATTILISPENDFQKIHLVHAKHEIILSAGAYQTPQILKLSGIGPANELKSLNITIVKDLPSVGSNLFDHIHLPLYVGVESPISLTMDKVMSAAEIFKYLLHGTGFYSNFGVIGFVVRQNGSAVGLFGTGSIDEKLFRGVSNYNRETFRSIFPLYNNSNQEGIVLLCTCHHPKSRGTVTLKNRNPKTPPLIDPNYLHEKVDIDCMIDSIRLAVRLVQSEVFQSLKPKIHWPRLRHCTNFGPTAKDFRDNSPNDRYLECLLRSSSITSHHPGGTASLGSVIDDRLRIPGIDGIRIADASILPTTIAGTPNALLSLIGRHAADIFLNDLSQTKVEKSDQLNTVVKDD